MTTPNAPAEPAQPPAQNGSRITAWIKRHTRGVVIGIVMGLGVMAIAGGGLGGYVAYIKQKAPPVVQGTAVTEAPALIVAGAETAARVVVGGGPGGNIPAVPEQAVPPVSLVIVEKNIQKSTDGGPDAQEVIKDGAYQINENNGAGGWFKIKAVMNEAQTAATELTLQVAGYGSNPATYDNDYETSVPPGTVFTVPAGQSESPAQRVKVQVRCDHQLEGDEMLSIKFVNQARSLQSNAILINIIDNCVPNLPTATPEPTATPTPEPTATPTPTRLPDRISISFSTSTSNSITVNWTEPNLNGSTMESYIVGHRVGGQDNLSWVDGPNLPTSERSYTIENLRPNTAYEIAVGYKVNSVYHRTGWIHFTSTHPVPTPVPTATPMPTPAPTPTPTPDPAQTPPGPVPYVGLYGSATDKEIISTWPEPTTGGPVVAYNVCINLHGSDRKDCVDTADRMHTFSNLAPGSYWITVTAKNSHGESEPQQEGLTLAPPPKD